MFASEKKKKTNKEEVMRNNRIRVAIVCQLKDASARLRSFIAYHLAVGFERLYLYFDDPTEVKVMAVAREFFNFLLVDEYYFQLVHSS